MTTGTYERALPDARRLPADGQRRLVAELEAGLAAQSEQDEYSRAAHVQAFLIQADALVQEISARRQGRASAVDAGCEQRCEL